MHSLPPLHPAHSPALPPHFPYLEIPPFPSKQVFLSALLESLYHQILFTLTSMVRLCLQKLEFCVFFSRVPMRPSVSRVACGGYNTSSWTFHVFWCLGAAEARGQLVVRCCEATLENTDILIVFVALPLM